MSATTEAQWFALLASVLEGLPTVYLTIDVEVLGSSFAESAANFSWPTVFLKLFQDLRARGIKTVVKVVLVSYGSPILARGIENRSRNLVVRVGGSTNRSMAVRGKAKSKTSWTLANPAASAFGKIRHNRDGDGLSRASTPGGILAAQAATT